MWVTGEREQRDHLMTTSTSVTHLHIVSLIFLRHPATHTHTRCLQAPGRHTLIYSGLQAQCNQRDMSTFIYSLFSLWTMNQLTFKSPFILLLTTKCLCLTSCCACGGVTEAFICAFLHSLIILWYFLCVFFNLLCVYLQHSARSSFLKANSISAVRHLEPTMKCNTSEFSQHCD